MFGGYDSPMNQPGCINLVDIVRVHPLSPYQFAYLRIASMKDRWLRKHIQCRLTNLYQGGFESDNA